MAMGMSRSVADEYLNRDPACQWEWHEAHRDLAKNMYRTTAMDMAHGREVHVKSDFPSGYGGHIPSIRHDILFRNTQFDRNQILKRSDPSRDAARSYEAHLQGIPTITQFPKGSKKTPGFKAIPGDGTTKSNIPWGAQHHIHPKLNYRNVPPTMKISRSSSSPGLLQQKQGGMSVNERLALAGSRLSVARSAAALQMPPPQAQEEVEFDFRAPPPRPQIDAAAAAVTAAYAAAREAQLADDDAQPVGSPGAARLMRTVNKANELAQRDRMPSEAEVLREQMQR